MQKHITKLNPNEIFVFPSNEAGIHDGGAASVAHRLFGAKYYVGSGLTGQCYAIPTKDRNIKTLPISCIKPYVDNFIKFAQDNKRLRFLVTAIGCGLAGYKPKDIAPMFAECLEMNNVELCNEFENYLIKNKL